MSGAGFGQFILEMGQLTIPLGLLDNLQSLDITPEELGYLVLALRHQAVFPEKEGDPMTPWLRKALDKGWACWMNEGGVRRICFSPLWQSLYSQWEKAGKDGKDGQAKRASAPGEFDYCYVVKELDRLRGSLSISAREKQMIQELNIKYGWSSEFIVNFFRLCYNRGLGQSKNYKPLAAQIHRSGVYTLEGLVAFMDQVDWISRQASELKRDYLGLYGMVTVTERDYYVKWHVTWKMSHSLIIKAAEAGAGASNASFKYLDTVLSDWYQQGVKSHEDSEQVLKRRTQEKTDKQKGRTNGGAGTRKREVKRDGTLWAGYEEERGTGDE